MAIRFAARLAAFAIAGLAWLGISSALTATPIKKVQFTTDFRLQDCQFQTEG